MTSNSNVEMWFLFLKLNFLKFEQTMRYAKLAPDSVKKNVLNLYQ